MNNLKLYVAGFSLGLLAMTWLTACSPSDGKRKLEWALEQAVSNRAELEQVLAHYEGDSLKYEAACFLIGNMPYHYAAESWFVSPKGYRYRPDLALFVGKEDVERHCDSLMASGYRIECQNLYDIRHIRADYLIRQIDGAFEVWKKPWAKEVSFDDFCRYILPYRSQNEPLVTLADTFRMRYLPLLDSAGVQTTFEACCLINDRLKKEIKYAETGSPLSGSVDDMERARKGACEALCDYTVHVMRALGIPVAVHQTVWTRMARGHVWPAVLSGGCFHDFSPGDQNPEAYPETLYRVAYLKPAKVYRKSYEALPKVVSTGDDSYVTFLKSPLLEDVTSGQKMRTYTLCIPTDDTVGKKKGKLLYLCAFNSLRWTPVAMGYTDGSGKAVFTHVAGRNFFMVAAAEGKDRLRMVAPPVCTYGDGRFKVLSPQFSRPVRHTFMKGKDDEERVLEYWDCEERRFVSLPPDEVTDTTTVYGNVPCDALLFYRLKTPSEHDRVGVIDSAGVYRQSASW